MTKLSLKKAAWTALVVVTCSMLCLVFFTRQGLGTIPQDLSNPTSSQVKPQYLDRYGQALNVTYSNTWNLHHIVPLHAVPPMLVNAFIVSEDKRFFKHGGVDWWSRGNAVQENLRNGSVVRGASTITEQVVRMLNPRKRTIWSRWLEGFDAESLEQHFSKSKILEFYLNQVPYQANRRGVAEASSFYFNRDLDTLSLKEMLALAVLVRAPRWLDPTRYPKKLERSISNLANRMINAGHLDPAATESLSHQSLVVKRPALDAQASHFIAHLVRSCPNCMKENFTLDTTLDGQLQKSTQSILNQRLSALANKHVTNGAVLVVDHQRSEILAWVVGNAGQRNKAYSEIDAITTPRQPGSALKPFVYAKALGAGWTAATMVADTPLEQSVGSGMHVYHNYSRKHYGYVSVREALGNSLNIPAVKAVQLVGTNTFLAFLHQLGIRSLTGHPNIYGDGISLGNGEVTLLEMVGAYASLARMGQYQPLRGHNHPQFMNSRQAVLNESVASLISDILSDPAARELEFGWDSILNFPHQTAVKTGTSSDYRDAWAFGYDDRYTVGIWLGNLDYTPMLEVTGASGAGLILRSVFNSLNQDRHKQPLYLSPNLEKKSICIDSGLLDDGSCKVRDEWFIPGHYPTAQQVSGHTVRIRKPSNGLLLAMDPRIPDHQEYFAFELSSGQVKKAVWYVNDVKVGTTTDHHFHWQVNKGEYVAHAKVWFSGSVRPETTENVKFSVK